MSALTCLAVTPEHVGVLAQTFFAMCAMTVCLSVNWLGWYDRIEWRLIRRRRRRRLAAIRERKSRLQA